MGNLALNSAEEPDNLRATTGTVEVPTKRDNDAALALGARPIQQHEPAARHNITDTAGTISHADYLSAIDHSSNVALFNVNYRRAY